MGLFVSYIRSRSVTLIAALLIILISTATKVLFDIPGIVVLYPLILCTLILLVSVGIDFAGFARRYRALTYGDISEPADAIEKEYRRMIEAIKEEADLERTRSSEDYNDMIGYYTVWAHQIKTPISAMRLMLQNEDTEESRRLSGELNRIESYVNMVMTYLRLGSESSDYIIRNYDLDDIIRPAVKKFKREFILKKIKLNYEPTDYDVITDEKWLSFIIEQVISNAVKYTDEGEVKISMSKPGILSIEDTGIGIAPEDLPRIFENGFTGFNGREDKRASGIGLYLCKRIADNLGHRIIAESKPGKGTVISLDLNTEKIGIE